MVEPPELLAFDSDTYCQTGNDKDRSKDTNFLHHPGMIGGETVKQENHDA